MPRLPYPRRMMLLAAAVALLVLALSSTWSAFTSTTSNSGNSFEAGTIAITDDDAGTAMFAVGGLLPGDSVQRCINVTNAGSTAFTSVALAGAPSGALASALHLTIDRGTGAAGGAGSGCAGFSAVASAIIDTTLDAVPTTVSPLVDTSSWNAGATRSYRFTVTLDAAAGNAMQGATAAADFTWQASS